ncbi:hypothetical protein KC946_03935 [Candidatus Saccharibacteria bacterium]|nr:hypothetical protein [Candidatus Saccharibacteria bacterium]
MKKQSSTVKTRGTQLLLAVLMFFIAWLLLLRATDTGSLQQWALVLLAIGLGFNRIYVGLFRKSTNNK